MSEYQSYEFVALDRPLTAKQMGELRAVSKRAEISPTRFWNEYHWGDLKADPAKLVARYFDAFVYFANWGTQRLMFRIPKAQVDVKALRPYFVGGPAARLTSAGGHVVLDLTSDPEDPDAESEGSLAALSPVRAELMRGDLRPAYLAWLLAVQNDDIDEENAEPLVPAGLAQLTAAQQAMVEFLRIDVHLIAAAAGASATAVDDRKPFQRWVKGLSAKEKEAWLRRAADAPDLALGGELLRVFSATSKGQHVDPHRTVAELRALAVARRVGRERTSAARAKPATSRAAKKARQKPAGNDLTTNRKRRDRNTWMTLRSPGHSI